MPTPEQIDRASGKMPVHAKYPGMQPGGQPPLAQGRILAVSRETPETGVSVPQSVDRDIAKVAKMLGVSNVTPEMIEQIKRGSVLAKQRLIEKNIPLPLPENTPPIVQLTQPLDSMTPEQRAVIEQTLRETSVEIQRIVIAQEDQQRAEQNRQQALSQGVDAAFQTVARARRFGSPSTPAAAPAQAAAPTPAVAPLPPPPVAYRAQADAEPAGAMYSSTEPPGELPPPPTPTTATVPAKEPEEKEPDVEPGPPPNIRCRHCGCEQDYEGPALTDDDKRDWLMRLHGAKFLRTYPLIGDKISVEFRTLTDAEERQIIKEIYATTPPDITPYDEREMILTMRMLLQVHRIGDTESMKPLPDGLSPKTNAKSKDPWFPNEDWHGKLLDELLNAFLAEGYEGFTLKAMRVQYARFMELCKTLAIRGLDPDFFTTTATQA